MGAAGTFEKKLRRGQREECQGWNCSYIIFVICHCRRQNTQGRATAVAGASEGSSKSCGIQERMMRRPRSDLRSWRDFCVLLLGVEWFQLQELLEPVIVNVNSKATFCPPGAAAVTCASNLGIERSDASAAVDKRFSLRVIFCIQAQHTVLLLRSLNPWHRSAIPLGHYQYLML